MTSDRTSCAQKCRICLLKWVLFMRSRNLQIWNRMKTQNIDVLKLIWQDKYPPAKQRRTLFEKMLLSFFLLVRFCSPSNVVAFFHTEDKKTYNFIDGYTLLVALFLTYILSISYPFITWDLHSILVVAVAICCISDIVCYHFCIMLIDSLNPKWKRASINRSLLLVFVNFYSLIAAFAILYANFGKLVHTTQCTSIIHNSFHFFYYSLISFATLGYGDFVPKDDFTRFIVVIQLFVEFFFLLTVVPALIGNLSDRMTQRQYHNLRKKK